MWPFKKKELVKYNVGKTTVTIHLKNASRFERVVTGVQINDTTYSAISVAERRIENFWQRESLFKVSDTLYYPITAVDKIEIGITVDYWVEKRK